MKFLKELNEASDSEYEGKLQAFDAHATDLGMKVHDRAKKEYGKDMSSAFLMKDEQFFDVMFLYRPDFVKKVMIEYHLGEGKSYRVQVPYERFMSFDKSEMVEFHKAIKEYAADYQAAVKVVKEMPTKVKNIIKEMVK